MEKVDVAQLTAAQLRVKQRQQKVSERMATSTPGERPSIDVFKERGFTFLSITLNPEKSDYRVLSNFE